MDFSKLSSNDKLATYGSVAVIVGGVASAWGGLLWFGVLAAVAMLAIIFLPQFSPSTAMPGGKGSLMLICGGVAVATAVLTLLQWMSWLGTYFGQFFFTNILFFVAVAGAGLMAWAGWKEFQAGGGKFEVGAKK